MKNIFKIKSKNMVAIEVSLFMVLLFLLPTLVQAQGGAPDFNDNTNDVPIDGGLSLLVAAGVGYGAKKMKERKRILQQLLYKVNDNNENHAKGYSILSKFKR